MLDRAEKLNWLRLIRSEAIGSVTFWALLERYGSATAALRALPWKANGRAIVLADEQACAAEWQAGERDGAILTAFGEDNYPELLSRVDPAPPLVWIKGSPQVFKKPTIAIVGARNASALGRRFAETLAQDFAAAGWAVASGLARGIDAAAHHGALQGGTIAVMAGGLDKIYPPENLELSQRLQEHGALISEMPWGVEPQARHFSRRNRIISGLAHGVVVVEAAQNSGSLITARYALEQGREVFAVPGSPLDPRARGSNGLLRDGATLTESAADVLASLQPSLISQVRPLPPAKPALSPRETTGDPALAKRVLELLSPAPTPIDDIVRLTGAPAADVSAAILELELAGQLLRQPGQQVSQA